MDNQIPEKPIPNYRKELADKFRNLRESHSYSIEDLAASTKIPRDFIENLEKAEWTRLPAAVFVRGFIRNLVNELGDDPFDYLALYDLCLAKEPSIGKRQTLEDESFRNLKDPSKADQPGKRSFKWRVSGVLVIFLILSGGLAYFVWNSKGVNQTEALSEVALEPTVEETQQVPAEPEPRPELALDQEVEGPLEQKPNDQFLMKEDENQEKTESYALSVTDGDRQGFQHVKLQVHAPVRVRVRIDGKAEITQDLEPNQYDFSFSRQAHFFIFNAAAVTLYFNDKPLGPLGSEGRRRSLSFHGSLSESTRF